MKNLASHPANIGRDYQFDGSISETVLRNYLSRSMVLSLFDSGSEYGIPEEQLAGEAIRLITESGAKYIARAGCAWIPSGREIPRWEKMRALAEKLHAADPDLVLEACIFETAYRSFEDFAIPAHVFEAFGLPVEERHFRYEDMLFPDGRYVDHWEKGGSVPDMTRLETQLFFYFRGCLYIAMGFEALHCGQVLLMGETDENHACWTKVMNLLREYARTHARRHFVMLNAHTHGMIGTDGKLLFDFHAYPVRPVAFAEDPPHVATEHNPQRCRLISGWGNSIYNRSMGGLTHSGWSCEHLPYFVEIDNYGCQPPELLNTQVDYYPWGYDEVSWFANQPKWYRKQWVSYAWQWLKDNDPDGYLELLGGRTARFYDPQKPDLLTRGTFYYVNGPEFEDFDILAETWANDNGQP